MVVHFLSLISLSVSSYLLIIWTIKVTRYVKQATRLIFDLTQSRFEKAEMYANTYCLIYYLALFASLSLSLSCLLDQCDQMTRLCFHVCPLKQYKFAQKHKNCAKVS